MKKFLLLSLSLVGLVSNAQVLEQRNYDNFTLGNLGSQQGYATMQGEASNYQIVNIDAEHGKSLAFVGPTKNSAETTYYAYIYSGLKAPWGARTAGNDILKVSFDLYTGAEAGTGGGVARAIAFNKEYASFAGISYDFATKTIKGSAKVTKKSDGSEVNALFTLGSEVYPANKWISVNYTYDFATGEVTWSYDGNTYSINNSNNPTYNVIPGSIPTEMDFVSTSTTANTIVHTSAFDNYKAEALVGNLSVATTAANAVAAVKIYPNPVQDVLNIQSDDKVLSVAVYNTAGQLAVSSKEASVNVNHLAAGVYLVKIATVKGEFVEKMIKK